MGVREIHINPAPGIEAWLHAIAAFLNAGGVRGKEWRALPSYAPALLIVCFGGIYGAVMASFCGVDQGRALMILYGAVKVPMLILATMLIAVPCFYVLNMLVGVGDDFGLVWKGLVDYQLLVALQLLALAPITEFENLTNGDYRTAQAWSTLMFAVAGWNAQRSLRQTYKPLIEKNQKHRMLRQFWFLLYAFIGIQMGWDLRPFVGNPDMPVQFFRAEIGNAYVETAKILGMFLRSLSLG